MVLIGSFGFLESAFMKNMVQRMVGASAYMVPESSRSFDASQTDMQSN